MRTQIKKYWFLITVLVVLSAGSVIYLLNKTKPVTDIGTVPNTDTSTSLFKTTTLRVNQLSPLNTAELTNDKKLLGLSEKSLLVLFGSEGDEKIIYPNPIALISYSQGLVVILERDAPVLSVIDVASSKILNKFNVSSYLPIISLSVSRDGKHIYFLGKYDDQKYISTLYSSTVNQFTPSQIITTTGVKIESLNNNLLLIFRFADQPGKSYVEIININNKSLVQRLSADSYSISLDGTKIASILSSSTTVYETGENDLAKPVSLNNPKPSLSFWRDNNKVVIVTNGTNTQFIQYDLSQPTIKGELIYTLSNNFVRSVVSASVQAVVIQDSFDKLIKIDY